MYTRNDLVEAEMKLIIGTSTWNSLPVGPNGDHSRLLPLLLEEEVSDCSYDACEVKIKS